MFARLPKGDAAPCVPKALVIFKHGGHSGGNPAILILWEKTSQDNRYQVSSQYCLSMIWEADGEAGFVVPLRNGARKDRDFLALSLIRELMCVQTDVGSDILTENR